MAHLGTKQTTFFKHHAGYGRAELIDGITNLPTGSGWAAEHAFATDQQAWDAASLLIAPTAFRTTMSKMQAANQLPMPFAANGSADATANDNDNASASASATAGAAGSPERSQDLPMPPTLPELPKPSAGNEFQAGELFTLKSKTIVQSFGTFWKSTCSENDQKYSIPNATNITLFAGVQLQFLAFHGDNAQIKPKFGFHKTISTISDYVTDKSKPEVKAYDDSTLSLHKGRVKAYNQGAQPAHA